MKVRNGLLVIVAVLTVGASTPDGGYVAFTRSHDRIHTGMTIRDVFQQGLADYLALMKNKNVPGATLPEKQPISDTCKRHVLDISYFKVAPSAGAFWTRVYCNQNTPSALQLIPERSFETEEAFFAALDKTYSSWAKSMRFRVQSPPKRIAGVYDYYEFTTDETGKVVNVSTIVLSAN